MAGGSDVRMGQTLILLVILCTAGGWNYHRNTLIEDAVPRPYQGYSDEELNQLMSAYQDEVEVQMAVYRKATAGKKLKVQGGGLMEERIDEFERVQAERLYVAFALLGPMLEQADNGNRPAEFDEYWRQVADMRAKFTDDLAALRSEARQLDAANEMEIALEYPEYPAFAWETE